ncbi:TPA: single-stranded DNA-binding protein [Candidatus Bathyarchaeota archaeon]|nr:single-stranded DNA-binding protein [Candidatus Bathyarchaeota archaeon]
MKIVDLKPGMRAVDVLFKVVEKGEPRETMSRKRVADVLVGDETGCVVMTLWEEKIDQVEAGKNYRIENGYTNIFRGSLRLNVGRYGTLKETDEEVAEVNTENNLSKRVYSEERRPFRRGYGRYRR